MSNKLEITYLNISKIHKKLYNIIGGFLKRFDLKLVYMVTNMGVSKNQ